MNAFSSPVAFIITGVLIVLLVAARIAIQSYGRRIGVDKSDFDQQPDPESRHARYATLKKIYLIASIVLGLWIIFLGAQMTLGAWTGYIAARKAGARLSAAQTTGALGMLIVFAGIGLITIQSTLRWDHRPDQTLNPRPAFRSSIARKPGRHANAADFSALAEASGDVEKPRSVPHWFNANPTALWGVLAAAILVFACYITLFVMVLPIR